MPSALVTGVGREAGIAAAVALELAAAGWDLGLTAWRPYDRAMPWTSDDGEPSAIAGRCRVAGRRCALHEVDLGEPGAAAALFDVLEPQAGPFTALVLVHCHDVEQGVMEASDAELARHFAVNASSCLALIQEFARRLPGSDGRVVAFTSDAVEDNVPYGASKAALERIVVAAARELGPRGIRVNAVNPGPTDTGWMSPAVAADVTRRTPLGRLGRPADAAALVRFLLSDAGGWISGQILYSNGGFS